MVDWGEDSCGSRPTHIEDPTQRTSALQGDTRRLSAQLEVPVRGFLNLKNKEKPIQGALGGIKIVIYARVPC